MASYNTSISLTGAFVLNAETLFDVFDACERFVEQVPEVKVEFGDTHKLTCASFVEALDDPLVRARRITQIDVDASNYKSDPRRRFSFKASNDTFRPAIELTLEGPQHDCVGTMGHLEPLLSARRQWYSPAIMTGSVPSTFLLMSLAIVLLALPPLVAYLFGWAETAKWLAFIELALSGLLLYFLYNAAAYIFPKMIVDVGMSSSVLARAQTMRNIVFVVIGLGFLINVAAAIVFERIK